MIERFLKKRQLLPSLFLLFITFIKPTELLAVGEYYDETGFRSNKTYISYSPQEYINPFSGNLILSHTDITLPGNGGLDLTIQRTYNSKIFSEITSSTFGIAGGVLGSLGVGWDLHFGRISDLGLLDNVTLINANPFFLQMPDGSIHSILNNDHQNINSNVNSQFITEDFWLINYDGVNNRYIMTLPDGTVYTFGQHVTDSLSYSFYYVTSIKDKNGNEISIEYFDCCNMSDPNPDSGNIGTCTNSNPLTKTRHIKGVIDSVGRVINFSMLNNSCRGNAISSIDVNGSVYNYIYFPGTDGFPFTEPIPFYDGGSGRLLKEVKPPVGPSWQYFYDVDTNDGEPDGELISVTYPSGGTVQYDYETFALNLLQDSANQPKPFNFRATVSRTRSGPNITPGTWALSYAPASLQDTTIVTDSCGTKEVYKFFGLREGSFNGVWNIGVLYNKETKDINDNLFELEAKSWVPYQISNNGLDPITLINGAFLPLLNSRTINRDGISYTTDFTYNRFYDSPTQIVENGELSRTTDITYFEDLTPGNYIIGKPLVTTFTSGTQTKTITNSYDSKGNLISVDKYGVTTVFSYHPDGNLAWEKNARGFYTHFDQYNFGVAGVIKYGSSAESADDSVYAEARTINWEGTIASLTDGRGNQTLFNYDGINRITSVTPPPSGEAQTLITYGNVSGRDYIIKKGISEVKYSLNGFGKPIGAQSNVGVDTEIRYDECGRRIYESLPFAFDNSTPNTGDSFTYDALERVKRITHPDNTSISYSYSGNTVTINNERNLATTYNFKSFGDPEDKRLSSIKDQQNNTTSYEHDLLGNITRVDLPIGGDRVFTYNSKNFLASENNPENGTTTYLHDEIGNVISKTNADSKTINYQYDSLNRLTFIDHPGGEDDVTYAYDDANNRTLMEGSSGGYSYSYLYDRSNRLTRQNVILGGVSYGVDFVYDERNNLIQAIYPSGEIVNYNYDAGNRLLDVYDSANILFVGNISYHPSGAPSHYINANSVSSDFTYDSNHRLKSLKISRPFPELVLVKEGLGSGTVASSPLGINCGIDCRQVYPADGITITLTATPDPDSNFVGWSGDPDCADGVVLMDANKTCVVTFALEPVQFTLTVNKTGTGGGTVTSSPGGIDCGSDCTEGYDVNVQVTLTPAPDAGSSFTGWGGDPDCSDGVVTMDASKTCTATFELATQQYTLGVVNNSDGFGSGTVSSNPAGISCSSGTVGDCTEDYNENTTVTLTATPATGVFGSWGGDADCSDGVVTMNSDKTCSATFVEFFTFTVLKSGTGSGKVTTLDGGINCGGDCTEVYGANNLLFLNATPDPGSKFTAWGGSCSGGSAISLLLDSNKTCTATFDLLPGHTLMLEKQGNGTGTVTSNPTGINCGSDCSENYFEGTQITLTPTPNAGSIFSGWSGDADCSDGVVMMNSSKTCTATFNLKPPQFTLTVSKSGTGTGIVTSNPPGISCGSDCTEAYDINSQVSLTAAPNTGSSFTGWGGDADCLDGLVTMDANKTCTANFTTNPQSTLTVTKSGTLTGTVTSNPAGIYCGIDCTQSYSLNTRVTLTPTPDSGSIFGGWEGPADCSDGVVIMDASKTCTAIFLFEGEINQVFKEAQRLVASDGNALGGFGSGVTIDGDTAVMGAPLAKIGKKTEQGAAYVFERDAGGVWRQVKKLTASDGAMDDNFGASVSASGDWAIVGIKVSNPNNPDSGKQGKAYVFKRDQNGVWSQKQILSASDGKLNDEFGEEVVISGSRLVVRAHTADVGSNIGQGAVYVFELDANGTWNQVTKLFSPVPNQIPANPPDFFYGIDKVAFSGDRILTQYNSGGSPLYAYLDFFERNINGVWSHKQSILDVGFDWGNISGDTAIVDGKVFKRSSNGTWAQVQSIKGGDAYLSGDYAVIDQRGSDDSIVYRMGSDGVWWSIQVINRQGQTDINGDRAVIQSTVYELVNTFNLTLSKSGDGTGMVTSSPSGINCGTACLSSKSAFAENTQVTLTAVPNSDSIFEGWSGDAECSDGVVTMNATKTCTATFTKAAQLYTLTVSVSGSTNARVTSNPPGISCPSNCTEDFAEKAQITLTPVPYGVSEIFLGWSGDADCLDGIVTMDTNKFCIATFEESCACSDPKAIIGTSGNDTLRGTSKNDIICGLEGNDSLTGQGGDDCLYGGPGNDTLQGVRGNDTLLGGQNDDTLRGDEGNDRLNGQSGTDNLDGGTGTDTCLSGETNTTCESLSGLKEINPPANRSKFITKEESHLNSLENLNKISIKISSHTGSRVSRISSYVESLRLILVSVLFASNAFAQIPPTAFIDLEYFYDGVSNVTGVIDHNDSANNCTMQYDSLDRLTNADGSWGAGSFTYDSVGNRMSKDIAGENVNYSYGADNRLSGVVHDANGNIIDDGTFTYTYDSENRLVSVPNGTDVITYEYDGDGRRIKRVTSGETTYYAYGVGLNVLTEFSGQRVPKFDYIYAGNRNIARVNFDATGTPESKTFYHNDHLGSNIAITDATSTVEWDRVYLPYGEGFNDPNVDYLQNTHEYTAKELDEDSGLYYYGARYYNPELGRFMSVDPSDGDITEPQSWNRYAYVLNNPFRYVDPDGEAAVNVSGIVKLNTQLRNKLGFLPNLLLDLLLPVEPEAIVASSIPGLQALGTGTISKGVGNAITKVVNNPVPKRVARVVDKRVIDRGATRLGAPDAEDVFVTAADDVMGIQSSEALAERLTLLNKAGELRRGPFAVIEFDTPSGIASPIFRTNPGFVGFGRTANGAREFVVPNLTLEELINAIIRTVP